MARPEYDEKIFGRVDREAHRIMVDVLCGQPLSVGQSVRVSQFMWSRIRLLLDIPEEYSEELHLRNDGVVYAWVERRG